MITSRPTWPRGISDTWRFTSVFWRKKNRYGHEKKEVSDLVRWSEESGAMWLHMLLSCGFNDTYSFPFTQLRQNVGVEKWKKHRWAVDPDEVRAFVAQKMLQLEEYDADLAKTEADKARVDRGELTKREFIAMYSHTLTNSATPDF